MGNLPSQRLMIKCLTIIQIELEFENVGFLGEGNTEVAGEKYIRVRTTTNHKLNPHMMPSPGIEPGLHWWEESVLSPLRIPAPPVTPFVF